MLMLRHAAALVLVGWYLMVPPYNSTRTDVDPTAPISKWQNMSSFDTADDCQEIIQGEDKLIEDEDSSLPDHLIIVRRFRFAQCVSTDDPRLKGDWKPFKVSIIGWIVSSFLSATRT
jgi:hypothetical protein